MPSTKVYTIQSLGSLEDEAKRNVDEHLLFHYGDKKDQMPFHCGPMDALNFPERCADICLEAINGRKAGRALDVGCSVGGSTFQLARSFEEVVGLDFNNLFITAASEMKSLGSKDYRMQLEGGRFKSKCASVAPDIDKSRVKFLHGDACNLPSSLGKFNMVLASNLLCRLSKPKKFLMEIPAFMEDGGYFVIFSTYSWRAECTDRSEWIEGPEAFAQFMADHVPSLQLVTEEEVPFILRKQEREYQYSVASCTVWRKC